MRLNPFVPLLVLAASLAPIGFAQSAPPPPADAAAPASQTTGPAAPTTPVSAPPGNVRLVGVNGRAVDFAGIWEARPEGLVVVTGPESPLALVAWDRFDLARLREDQPAIDAARQRALFLRSPQPVNLGLFAGLLTPAQAGTELRQLLDTPVTIKVPVRYRTTTTTRSTTRIEQPLPVVYNGIILQPPGGVSQSNKTVSETRFSPDEITTSPRRVLSTLARTDDIAMQDRRDLFDLVKTNPVLLEETAAALDRISASLPPRHLLANDPTVITLAVRLREFSEGLRKLSTALGVGHSDQMLLRDLLYLADSPSFR
jgi:hypothetical protein